MSIVSCFENIEKALTQRVNVRMALGEEHIDVLEEYIGQQQPKPSVIWVPVGAARITPMAGPRSPTARKLRRPTAPPSGPGEAVDTQRIGHPGMYASRKEQIDAYVWAADLQTCETLLNLFVGVARIQATGFAFQTLSTRWAVGSDRKPKRGSLCILRFWLRLPFTFPSMKVAEYPISLQLTGQIVQ